MKLSTILRRGEARPALILVNAVNRCQHCLDLVEFSACLAASGCDWGIAPTPASLLGIIEGGQPALDNLKRIQDRLMAFVDAGNRDLYEGTVPDQVGREGADVFGPALVPPAEVRFLPPVPDVPLFVTFHGNGITLWRDRLGTVESRTPPRLPACRLHPATSLLGHEEPLIFPANQPMGFSNELGVVIAPGGKDIPYDQAHRHIWGITNCNDATRSGVWPIHYGRPYKELVWHEREGRARLGRASDAASAFGPWITTVDEVPNVHDLLIHCWGPDGSYCRAHSSAYIMGPRNVVDYFSRFMTLPAGTILQFGAPGTDGVGGFDDIGIVHGKTCEMDMEHVGILSNPLWCEEKLPDRRQDGEGFYGLVSRLRGIDIAAARREEDQPFPRGTRSVWAVAYNDRITAQQADFAPDRQRHYEIFPRSTLSTGQPVVLPAIGADVEVSCELAAVVGPRPIARLAPADVAAHLLGITILVGLRDNGLPAELKSPTTRELFFGRILGRWYDGCNAIRPELSPPSDLDAIGAREMRVEVDGLGPSLTNTSDYLLGFAEAISFMSREITFLPGDVISLGPAGAPVTIPADRKLPEGSTIRAAIEGIGEMTVPVIDKRRSSN